MRKLFLLIAWIFSFSISFAQTKDTPHQKFTNPLTGFEYTIIGKDTTVIIDIMPQFPGGQEQLFAFLRENIKYPKKARRDGIQGKVLIKFTIDTAGYVRDIIILQSLREDIDNAATKLISQMPRWTPGYQKGKAIPVQYNLPLNYSLTD